MLTCFTELFLIGRNMDCRVTGRSAAKLIGGRGLFELTKSHLINSVHKSSRIKHHVYSESDKTLYNLVAIQLMK